MLEIERSRRDTNREKILSKPTATGGHRSIRDGSSTGLSPASDFTSALEEAEAARLEADLDTFVSEIMAQGERLKQHPNRNEFLRYKAMVARFLKRILKLAMKTGKTRRRDREYVYMDILDSKLYELGHYLLLEEAETMTIAAAIDEIKGLLYDSLRNAREGTL